MNSSMDKSSSAASPCINKLCTNDHNSSMDALLHQVMHARDGSLPAYLDAVFGFLARHHSNLLERGSGGIELELLLSQSVASWRRKVKANSSQAVEKLDTVIATTTSASQAMRDVNGSTTLSDARLTSSSSTVQNTSSEGSPDGIGIENVAQEVTISTAAHPENGQPDTECNSDAAAYYWSQTVEDLDIRVPVSAAIIKGKQVDVTIERQRVRVAERREGGGANVLLRGNLHAAVDQSESLWDLTPGQHVTLHLAKQSASWWGGVDWCVVGVAGVREGAQEAERALSSLPQHEQADIQRVMFDAQQKQRGQPTSDVLKAESVLRDAWEADGSPFAGQPFDPAAVNLVTQQ